MSNTQCKSCRRTGQKLFLKEDRCFGPKCAVARKPYPPGKETKTKSRRPLSEFGTQLKEKQALRFLYGLREKQFVNVVKKATKEKEGVTTRLVQILELRLDNVVYRLGLAKSRSAARQLVGHGHITVNGRKVTIPSYQAKVGDAIAIREQSAKKKVFEEMDIYLKKYSPPSWLKLDKNLRSGQVAKEPEVDPNMGINLKSIIEFYSR